MSLIRPGREDDLWPPAAHRLDDLHLFFAAGAQSAVAEIELFAKSGAEDFRGGARLALADLRRAARAHLAAGEIDDSRFASGLNEIDDRAATGELDVIGVRGEKDRVDCLGHHKPTISNVATSGSASLTMRSTSCSRNSHQSGSHATTRS